MTKTETQPIQSDRSTFLGASELPAVCGVSPWATPYDVWLSKIFPMEPQPSTRSQLIGLAVEDQLLDFAQEDTGLLFQKRQAWKARGPMAATLDGLDEVERVGAEAKYRSMTDDWGSGSSLEDCPEDVQVQCAAQAHVWELQQIVVPVWLLRSYRLFLGEPDPDLVKVVAEKGQEFWEHNVLGRHAPKDSLPAEATIKRIIRPAGKSIELPEEYELALAEYESHKRAAKAEDGKAGECKKRILAALQDAEEAVCGPYRITYRQVQQNVKAHSRSFRTLRIKRER